MDDGTSAHSIQAYYRHKMTAIRLSHLMCNATLPIHFSIATTSNTYPSKVVVFGVGHITSIVVQTLLHSALDVSFWKRESKQTP